MKGMQKIQRGSGFRGCADYLFDHDNGRVVGGNMSGMTARALAAEFGVTRRQRPDVAKPVWHNSLRLPVDERVQMTDEKWREIADDYMRGMGFSDQHPRVYVHHEPGHIHILASRVALDGSLYLGKNENLRSTGLIQRLEQVYGLTVTKGPKRTPEGRIAPPEVRKTRQGERRRYERLEDEPPRERLQKLVSDAAQGKPTASEFVARLQAQGVSVWPNVASTGRLTGFSFGIGGVAFTGNQLGDRYRWARLQKAGVHYDPARDMDALLAARPAEDPAEMAEAGIEGAAEVQPQTRAIDGFQAEEGRYGVRFRGPDGKGAFFDSGSRIAVDAWQDPVATLAALQLAQEKWGAFQVYGPPEYQQMCARLAAEHGFRVKNPDLQDAIQAMRPPAPAPVPEVAAVTMSHEPEPEPAPEVEAPAPEVDDRPRPAMAEGLDLTPEELEVARRLEEEAAEYEAIQAILDAPDPEPGPRATWPRM